MHLNEIKKIARQLLIDAMPKRKFIYRALRNRYGDEVAEQIFGELDAIEEKLRAESTALVPAQKEERRD